MYTKEIAKAVRDELKVALPGWKFSVVYEGYSGGSSIDLALVSGPEEVGPSYEQLNHYYPDSWRLTETGKEVMRKAVEILSKYHWDESDAQIDYFCCNFYMHVAIGKWNKPYEVKA